MVYADTLEARIRADGWHPDNLNDEGRLALAPPFEWSCMGNDDLVGLRMQFALDRLMFRYMRGSLGKDSQPIKKILMRLAVQYMFAESSDFITGSWRDFVGWYVHWQKTRLQPAERRLDQALSDGADLGQLVLDWDDQLDPALTNTVYAVAVDCFGLDEKRYLANLRAGYGMHLSGVPRPSDVPPDDRDDARQAVPETGIGSVDVFAFLERDVPNQTSVLWYDERGVAPHPVMVKTRLDSHGCRPKNDEREQLVAEVPDHQDETAVDAVETDEQAAIVQALLERIRDAADPGSARHVVASSLAARDDQSLTALASASGLAVSGLSMERTRILSEVEEILGLH